MTIKELEKDWTDRLSERCDIDVKDSYKELASDLLSTPIPKECFVCGGARFNPTWEGVKGMEVAPCETCKGTGKVSTTLKELVEEYLK